MQATGEDSQVDLEDIPALTEEQLSKLVTLREVRERKAGLLTHSQDQRPPLE